MKMPEQYRVRSGAMASDKSFGNNGAFVIDFEHYQFFVIASDGEGWEHISISLIGKKRTPSWKEMCYFKDLFWDKDEAVVQFHPPESDYVNNHDFCLHLWKPKNYNLILPPSILVGLK
jgi:hypothetical protein